MPVKNKRNAISRKQYNETNQELYSNSIMDEDTSGSSPPPLCIPPPQFRPLSPPSDPEPDTTRKVMTHIPDQLHGLSLDGDEAGHVEEEPLPISTAPHHPARPLRVSVETQVHPEDVQPHTPSRVGHVRSPILAKEPSTLESFSRTIRSYVPSSIPIPSAVPTPPRVSRPLSFGSFLTPSRSGGPSSPHSRVLSPPGTHARRRSSDIYSGHERHSGEWRAQFAEDELNPVVFNLDEDATGDTYHTKYPSSDHGEEILWSRWDILSSSDFTDKKVLVLGYPSGIQIWDCSDLNSISEVLNLSGTMWRGVVQARILPTPRPTGAIDRMAESRPLIGFLRIANDLQEFLVYSLKTHQVVQAIVVPTLVSFACGPEFIALGTTHPPTIQVLSSRTFSSLYTVSSPTILPFAHIQHQDSTNNVLSGPLEPNTITITHTSAIPEPIFALSNRLLAYASISVASDASDQATSRTPHTAAQDAAIQESLLKLPMSQADLGSAAVKLGGSVLSGMKVLGGMAYTAARAGVSVAMASDTTRLPPNHSPPTPGRFYSRSAPAASGRQYSDTYPLPADLASPSMSTRDGSQSQGVADVPTRPKNGYTVSVLDLESLKRGARTPQLVSEFIVSREQPISKISFSGDGTSLVVACKDGQSMTVYKLLPTSVATAALSRGKSFPTKERTSSSGHFASEERSRLSPPWHVYDLRRGRTSGIVESLDWANDGRWIAVGTRKRTIHLFATNPYGGPSDENSHLEGKVSNIAEVQPLSTELYPVVRLRAKSQRPEHAPLPLSFTFVPRSPFLGAQPQGISPSSSPSSGRSVSASPPKASDRTGCEQDVLVFDPQEGALSLRRIIPSRRAADGTPALAMSSMSVPGVNAIHRLTTSTSADAARQPSALTRMMGGPSHLTYHESHIANWVLRRGSEWKEVKPSLKLTTTSRTGGHLPKSDWLAQAELSTCSRSTRLIPRTIYLAHQFSFFYLGEDYHALLRSHHLDVPATKVEVRRQIEVSASGAGMGESFVSGSSLPSHVGFSSSFDEPLASALSAELRSSNPSPPVIPMYPNGPISRSHRPAIPIRNVAVGISDGMSESLGRLRREIGKVRSPRLLPRGDSVSASVPLEFDEEDEDFLSLDIATQGRDSRATSQEGASVSTPSTGIEPLPAEQEGDTSWEGWSNEDKQAVDDVEQFDDIGVGYMDEEWPHATVRARSRTRS